MYVVVVGKRERGVGGVGGTGERGSGLCPPYLGYYVVLDTPSALCHSPHLFLLVSVGVNEY